MPPDVLVVDNDGQMASMLAGYLERHGLPATAVTSGAAAIAELDRRRFAVIVTDLVMDGVDGLVVLRHAQRFDPMPRVILMTAFGTLETAIAAIREGAYDYRTKPFKMVEIEVAVRRALDHHQLGNENRRLRAELERQGPVAELLGVSSPMKTLKERIAAVASSDATLLLIGESGSGKELVARAVHALSERHRGPFVAVNCAAIPEHLLESELFGHEKGAFTGAAQKRRGLFAEADGGTLFLDEIGDMLPALQSKLLRALQDKTVRPVGGRDEIAVDLRLISATNQDLARLVEDKRFREDLYYRLAVIPIEVPSLRERADDIPLLARHFAEQAAQKLGKHIEGLSREATSWLAAQRWPGNVRQLANVMERAVTLAPQPLIGVDDVRPSALAPQRLDAGVRPTLAELEHDYIFRVLEEVKWDKRAAARILGVSIRTLQRRTPSNRGQSAA